ncbi:MAG: hypothetical protein INR63_30220 [Actinomycetospora chiangmaiensis]|nr:hypothetical protein [Actinomycetospora chiangmaiensis]
MTGPFRLPAGGSGTWVPASKFDLFAQMGVAWQGCVEERPAPYTTTDTPAQASNPDTLFVPYLWPDEEAAGQSAGRTALNGYFAGTGGACAPVYAQADAPGSTTPVTNVVANTLRGDTQTMVCKYRQAPVSAASGFSGAGGNRLPAGPNLLCQSRPLTLLTTESATLNAAVNAMTPDGDTNLVGGFMWAWRTISPNGPFAGVPGSGGRTPAPYGSTNKVIILMTDGFNHWANAPAAINGSAYSSFGYFANGRLGATTASNYRNLMDGATLSACANAKAAGVQVFTVGFSTPSDPIDATGLDLLQSCASQPGMAYVAPDGAALVAAFGEIAGRLGGLRLVN